MSIGLGWPCGAARCWHPWRPFRHIGIAVAADSSGTVWITRDFSS